jgi:NitT/TauT family transport system permease protein
VSSRARAARPTATSGTDGAPRTDTSPGRRRLPDRTSLLVVGLGVVLVVAWEVAVRALGIPGYILPAPSAVLVSAARGLGRDLYTTHLLATLAAMAWGYVVGATLGIVLGALVAEFRVVERLIYPYVVALQSLPKIALAPLFVMWFGYGLLSKVVMVILMCFFPLMVNTMIGLMSTDRDRIDLLRTMDATRVQIFLNVKAPSAAGHIFAGLQVTVILSLIATLVAEFVGSDRGLGNLIQVSQSQLDTAGMFVVLAILAIIGTAGTALVRWAHARVVFWEAERAEVRGVEEGN